MGVEWSGKLPAWYKLPWAGLPWQARVSVVPHHPDRKESSQVFLEEKRKQDEWP